MRASRSILLGGLAASLVLGQPASGTLTSGRKPALGGQIGSGGKTGSAGTAGQGQPSAAKAVRDYPVKPVPFTAVHFNDAFWAPRIEINRTVTIPFAFQKDEAHYQATGKRALLDIALKTADLLTQTFGPGKQSIWPGHQITEMGLVKVYRVLTG